MPTIRASRDDDVTAITAIYAHHVLHGTGTFEIDPPAAREGALYDLLNRINDQVWTGCFTFWPEPKLMVWRYGLCLAGGQVASAEQIDRLINGAVLASERFYPAFQLVSWADRAPAEAIKVALAEAWGRA